MKNWEVKKLGELLTIERGGSPRPIEKYMTNAEDGINWIKISDATASEKYIYETKEKITKEGLHKTRVVNEGDFILSNSMSFGRPYIMKTTGCIHDGWLVLKENGKKVFDTEFLYYLLSSPYVFQQFNFLAAGSTVRNLNIGLVSSVKVPIPPLSEQQRIVAILDEAFAAIAKAKANAQQNLQNAKELFESYLQRVFENKGEMSESGFTGLKDKQLSESGFIGLKDKQDLNTEKILKSSNLANPDSDKEGWEEKKLGEITSKIGSGATPKGGNESYKSEGISLVRSMNVHDFEFRDKNLAFIDDQQAKELNNVTLQENDVLLNITGASVARCCVIPKEYLPARVNQHVSIIRAKKEIIDPIFLNLLLTSKFYKDQLLFTGEQGATRQAITKAQLEVFKIAFPKSIKEQKNLMNKLEALSAETKKLEAIYQQKINDLEELKKSVLQKAFSGQLSESGFSGLKDEQDLDAKHSNKKILKSLNQANPDSDKK